MEFTVEFYESSAGRCPIREFLDEFVEECSMKRRTNFDLYLEEQLKDPEFAERFKKAGEAWNIALQLASLREACGLSQKELAERVGTSQQQISRLESPSYEGHSLSMLRRVAEALGATLRVEIRRRKPERQAVVAEGRSQYGISKQVRRKLRGRP